MYLHYIQVTQLISFIHGSRFLLFSHPPKTSFDLIVSMLSELHRPRLCEAWRSRSQSMSFYDRHNHRMRENMWSVAPSGGEPGK